MPWVRWAESRTVEIKAEAKLSGDVVTVNANKRAWIS